MRIVEYKKYREASNSLVDPTWVIKGGLFPNELDNKWLGIIEDVANVKYFIPKDVIVLTLDECVDRQVAIHNIKPFNRIDLPGEPAMTLIEIQAEVYSVFEEYGVTNE
jgi:hypothetical protein